MKTRLLLALLLLLAAAPACARRRVKPPPAKPDYARPLPEGAPALRKVDDPALWPDLKAAWSSRDDALLAALDRSVLWFRKPSTVQWFPIEGITHEQAEASVRAAREILAGSAGEEEFDARMREAFDCWESVGWDGSGAVFFTGYFAPVFRASLVRKGPFEHPIYARPPDLATDEKTGEPQGRKLPDGGLEPYPTRAEIDDAGMLAGTELAWFPDSLSAYLVHVNGSAKLLLPDGKEVFVGYAGKTDRPYTSLGQVMVDRGLLRAEEVSLPAIRRVYAENPAAVEELMRENECFVFFRRQDGGSWPSGSLGFPVTGRRTLATDKRTFPRGGLVVATVGPEGPRFLLDQDTGGAIRAAGRADIFMGVGPEAEVMAGTQKAEGRLAYLFLKPERVAEWLPPKAGGP